MVLPETLRRRGLARGRRYSCVTARYESVLRPSPEAEPPLPPGGRVVRHGIAVRAERGRAEPDELLGGRRAPGPKDDRHALIDRLEIQERVVRKVGRDPRSERRLDVPRLQ